MEINYSELNKRKRGRQPKYTEEQIRKIKGLYQEGYSQVSISRATGIPQRTVSCLLKK